VADAVDREHHHIGAAHQATQKPAAIVDAAVVMQEAGAQPFAQRAQMAQPVGAAADIEQRQAGEGRGGNCLTILGFRPETRFDRFELRAKCAFAPFQRAALLTLVSERVVRARQPLLGPTAPARPRCSRPCWA
jgi:hypothetical protein